MKRFLILPVFFIAVLATHPFLTGCPNSSVLRPNTDDESTSKDAGSPNTTITPEKKAVSLPTPRPRPVPVDTSKSLEEGFEEAVKLASNQPSLALQKFLKLAEKKPRSYQIWYNIGVLYDRQANPSLSESAYRKALRYKGDLYPAIIGLIRLYLRQNRTSQAKMFLQSKLQSYPKNFRLRNALIYLYIRDGRLHQAERLARNIQKKDEKNAEAITNLGLVWFKQSKYELARTAFNLAIASDKNLTVAYYYLAHANKKLKDPIAAIETLKKVLKIQKAYPEAHNLLGLLYYKQGKVKKAQEHYKEAITYMPNFWQAQLNYAITTADLKHYRQAAKIYRQLIKKFPYQKESYYHLGVLYLDRDIQQGLLSYPIAIPIVIQSNKKLIKLYTSLKRYKTSIHYLQTYINKSSGLSADAPVKKYLASAQKKHDRTKKRLLRSIKRELKKYLRKSAKRPQPPRTIVPKKSPTTPKSPTSPK